MDADSKVFQRSLKPYEQDELGWGGGCVWMSSNFCLNDCDAMPPLECAQNCGECILMCDCRSPSFGEKMMGGQMVLNFKVGGLETALNL